MTNQIHIEIYVEQVIGMAEKALENYDEKMKLSYDQHLRETEEWNKKRSLFSRLLFGDKTPETSYKFYYSYMSDKRFVNLLHELINLARSKGTTGQKVNLSIDLDKWDMLTRYYGGFNESKTNML